MTDGIKEYNLLAERIVNLVIPGGAATYFAALGLADTTEPVLIAAGLFGIAGGGVLIAAGLGVAVLIIYAETPS